MHSNHDKSFHLSNHMLFKMQDTHFLKILNTYNHHFVKTKKSEINYMYST